MPDKMDYLMIGLGALAAVLISSYVPSLVSVSSTRTLNYSMQRTVPRITTLERIPGIDLKSLSIARQNGLI